MGGGELVDAGGKRLHGARGFQRKRPSASR
jgi:hypothetical protein